MIILLWAVLTQFYSVELNKLTCQANAQHPEGLTLVRVTERFTTATEGGFIWLKIYKIDKQDARGNFCCPDSMLCAYLACSTSCLNLRDRLTVFVSYS